MSGTVYEDIGGKPVAQHGGGLLVTTDACLLSAFVKRNGRQRVCELCAGSGVISAMLLTHKKAASCVCVDFQPELCRLAEENALNYGGRMSVVCSDALDYSPERTFDAVVCNPPYHVRDSKPSADRVNDLSRRESTATIRDFAACASRALRDGGKAYFCYDPARLAELISALRDARLEPKVLTLVYPDRRHRANLALLSSSKNGAAGLTVTRPLFLDPPDDYGRIIKENTTEILYE